MPVLSERLSLIASMVPQGKSVCDVGTDHGYLPAALCLNGKYKSVTATDIKEKPLENARKNLEKLGINNVKLILCDGLQKVNEEEAETVIIAGMGGDVISGIIDRCPFKEKSVFILQPMTAAPVLREYLAKNGFYAEKEIAVTENHKIYSVMLYRFDGKKRTLSPSQKRIGALKPTTNESIKYIKKQFDICNKCITDLKGAGISSPALKENIKAADEIRTVMEGFNIGI